MKQPLRRSIASRMAGCSVSDQLGKALPKNLILKIMKENKEMKSRFTYGFFAGFATACLFFFLFFLFVFPSTFRGKTEKNPLSYQSVLHPPTSPDAARPGVAYYRSGNYAANYGEYVDYYE